ncbi:MAG: hypothetical protein ABSC17_08865 [Thermacetogeniaceae bacterium]
MKSIKKLLMITLTVAILGIFSVGTAMADSSSTRTPPIASLSPQSRQELVLSNALSIDDDALTTSLKMFCSICKKVAGQTDFESDKVTQNICLEE